MIELLVISKRYPHKENLNSGIYVYNRLKALKSIEPDINITMGVPIAVDGLLLSLYKKLLNIEQNKVKPEKTLQNINVIEIPYIIRLFDYKRGLEAKRLTVALNKIVGNYHIVHAHFLWEEGVAAHIACKNNGVKCVITAHGVGVDLHLSNMKYRDKIISALNGCEAMCYVGKELMKTAITNGADSEGYVINNGVDRHVFKPFYDNIPQNNNKKIIGFVGNFYNAKGADRLPNICSRICDLNPDVKFLLIGTGPLLPNIISEFHELNLEYDSFANISYEKMPSMYNKMDVLIAPSRREAFSCVALEARACGVPVVAPNLGGFSESVGEGGILIDTNEFIENMARAAVDLLNNPLSREEISKATENMTWTRTVEKEADVYRRVLNE